MLQRRTFAWGLCGAALVSGAWAQRPAQPIARPPGVRLGGVAGRFNGDGVASGAMPGVYVVVSVDAGADALTVRDDTGRTGVVHVKEHVFDLDELQPGEEVEIDFLMPDPGSTKYEAGGVWKVQR